MPIKQRLSRKWVNNARIHRMQNYGIHEYAAPIPSRNSNQIADIVNEWKNGEATEEICEQTKQSYKFEYASWSLKQQRNTKPIIQVQ